jgi:hypothetical protein
MKQLLVLICLCLLVRCTISAQTDVIDTASTIPIGDALIHQVVNNYLILQYGDRTTKESSIRVIDLQDNRETLNIPGPYTVIHFGRGEHPAMVVSLVPYEDYSDARIYDLAGAFLFSTKNLAGILMPSPNGKYFFQCSGGLSGVNHPRVFGRTGVELCVAPNSTETDALNDSLVVLFGDSVRVFDVFKNSCVAAFKFPNAKANKVSPIDLPRCDGKIVTYLGSSFGVLDARLGIVWTRDPGFEYVDNAALSDNASHVALYCGEAGRHGDHILDYVNYATGQTVWSDTIPSPYTEGSSWYPSLLVIDNKVVLQTPQTSYYSHGMINDASKTIVYTVNDDGTLISRQQFKGVADILAGGPENMVLVRADSGQTYLSVSRLQD